MKWIMALILLVGLLAISCGGETPRVVEIAVLQTTLGTIEMVFFPDVAPLAVESFKTLAARGYYDGTTFHRVIDHFMIQGGDPTATGSGGESIWGAPFADEFSDSLQFDQLGRMAMANRGPNTNGSQFFITVVATPHLNGKHTIFGQVVNGMSVVQAIARVETDKQGRPISQVTINRVRVERVGWIGEPRNGPLQPSPAPGD
jgi:cyclophilin family peptidyl-prolyl cis-trans isomerase